MSNLCHIISVNTKQTDKSLQFFSIRRRHTRCGRDWSSDVCSSDLAFPEPCTGLIPPEEFGSIVVSIIFAYERSVALITKSDSISLSKSYSSVNASAVVLYTNL